MSRNLLILLTVALYCLCLAACGDSQGKDGGEAGSPTPDPCSLLRPAEAQALLGQEVGQAQSRRTHNPLGQAICLYPAKAPEAFGFVQLSLVRTQGMSAEMRGQGFNAGRLFQEAKALLDDPQEVPGLGQAAYYGGAGLKAGAGLHVLQGDYYLNISVGGQEPSLDKLKDLARAVLGRLP